MRSATTVTFTVLVPTYQRVMDLKRCIDAIERQERLPDCVLIVCRTSDTATQTFLQSLDSPLPIEVKFVEEPGMIAALNVGLEHVTTDLVALTDDDAAPHPDWLARSERHFIADSGVGGVGGRDFVDGCFFVNEVAAGDVGRLQWFGRTIGNHHRGAGHPGTVDFLKGVNMAFRTEAIRSLRFDERLRGNGAQVHNELGFSLAIRRRGWKLVYDPRVAVDHFPGQRVDGDARAERSIDATGQSTFNETLAILEHLPAKQIPIFWVWAVLVGKRDAPGLLQCFRFRPFARRTWALFAVVMRARLDAFRAAVRR